MPRLEWDKVGNRYYETGVDRGVLYVCENGAYPKGVAWDGLTAVNESPSGAEASPFYADNKKYFNLMSAESYGATIECFYTPEEFDECDGTAEIAPGISLGQQSRKTFGFSFRTLIGSDTEGTDKGYKIHLVYGCVASPSEKSHNTVNESPDAPTLSYTISTTPVDVTGFKPTACITIDSTKVTAEVLKIVEDAIYGTDAKDAYLPLPNDLVALLPTGAIAVG